MEMSPSSASTERVSLWSIVSTDGYAHLLAWMIAVVVLCTAGIYVHWQVTGLHPEESWSDVALGVGSMVAVMYGLLRWRAARVASLVATGHRVPATLDGFFSFGQWVRVRFSYEYLGRPIHQKMVFVFGKRTNSLKGRSQLTAVVHPDDPRRVTIAELYEEKAATTPIHS